VFQIVDTLTTIARMYNISWQSVQSAMFNHIVGGLW